MKKAGEHIRVNFGQSPFVFDIDGMMAASTNRDLLYLFPFHILCRTSLLLQVLLLLQTSPYRNCSAAGFIAVLSRLCLHTELFPAKDVALAGPVANKRTPKTTRVNYHRKIREGDGVVVTRISC